jgi:branched-chain amino acid transport system substrate-binding protein
MSRFRSMGALFLAAVLLGAVGCQKSVQIGAIISETGAADTYGLKVRHGLEMALEEVNAAGGAHGKPVELVWRDDATNPEVGLQAATEMVEELGLRVVIGAVTSSVTLRIAPVFERNRAILLSPTASAPQITQTGDWIFRNYPSDILEGTSMADFARDLGLERIAVLAVDNEFGEGLREVFAEKFQSKFREIVGSYVFPEGDTAAIDQILQELRGLKPEAIYLISYTADAVHFLRRKQELKLDAIVLGTSSIHGEVFRRAGSAAENLIYPQPSFDADSDEPGIRDFVGRYRERYKEEPDTFAAHGYDALKLLVLAIQRGGSAHPSDVRVGLLGISDYVGASGHTAFDDSGDVVQYPRIFIVRQGRPVAYDRFVREGGQVQVPGRG